MADTTSRTVLGVINAAGAPLVAAGVCSGMDVPAAAPAGVAAAVGAGMLARHWLGRIRAPWSEVAFKTAAALGGGAWAAWSTMTGPWHVTNLALGAGVAVIGVLVAPAFLASDPSDASTMTAAGVVEGPSVDARAVQWKRRLESICRVKPVTITKVDDWPNGAGYTLHVRFAPESGDTWQSVAGYAPGLAGAVYLPKGCVIGVSEGDRQGTAEVRVPTVNALGEEDVWMTDQVSRSSICDDHTIATYDDTSDAVINLRQEAGLIVSRRGGGKTTLLNRIICRLLECEDNLTWVIDLNGGGLAVPFTMPFIDGEVDRSPIDWIAYDADEALLMAEVASLIARDRKARYGRLKARANTDLLPVSKDLPQVTIIIDESAEVWLRAPKAMEKLLEVQRIGRAEAVNVVFSALRGTQDTVPVPVRKQATLKVCGVVESDSELEYVIPGTRLRSAELIHPGTMYLSRGKGVRQVKVQRTSPQLIAAVVRGTASWRTTLDAPGLAVAGDVYGRRWQRLEPWLAVLRGEEPSQPVAAAPGRSQEQSAGKEPTTPAGRAAARDRVRVELHRFMAREQAKERVAGMAPAELDSVFTTLLAGVALDPESPGGGVDVVEWSPQVLLDIVRLHPGITPTRMQEKLGERGITIADKTLFKWLDRFVEDGSLRRDSGRYEAAQ